MRERRERRLADAFLVGPFYSVSDSGLVRQGLPFRGGSMPLFRTQIHGPLAFSGLIDSCSKPG